MSYVNARRAKMNIRFHQQKRHAQQRGIPFRFSFSEWIAWWEDKLGPAWLEMRGCRRGQYVMARFGDQGDYCVSNVKCVLCSENQSEQLANGKSPSGWNRGLKGLPKRGNKLKPEQVVEIFYSRGSQRVIAKRFGVSPSMVSRIKTANCWAWVVGKTSEVPACAS